MTFKRILSIALATLLFYVASAQQQPAGSYTAAWKKIDSTLLRQGLTASALTEVNKIYERAKKEKNNPQIIRALIYKTNLQSMKEEEAGVKNIQTMEKEIPAATEPARSILQSLTATLYWRYFQQNRWKLYNRTQTVNFKKDDLESWGMEDFHQKISQLYLASVAKETILQQTKLAPYDPVIIKGNVRHLRPTLYDLLTNRALEYFRNDERYITQPAYSFEMDDPAAYADAATFSNHNFTTRDTASLFFHALKLYQRLIRFHLADAQPDALVDADINRISFVRMHAVMENNDALYQQALERITNKYENLPAATGAWFRLAQFYVYKAEQYNPLGDTSNRYAYLQAKAICERVAAQKDSSEGWANCKNLLLEITRPEMNIQTEKVNVPGTPFRSLVTWRNLAQLHFRIAKIDKAAYDKLIADNDSDEEYWKKLLALPVQKSFSRDLPDTRDMQRHSVEIPVDSLSVGQYVLIASANSDFSQDKNPLAVQHFYVSNIAWIQKGQDFFVLHRETGQPLARANVQVWYQFYDNARRRNALRKGENMFTDKDGHFAISSSRASNEYNYLLEIRNNSDYLYLNDLLYDYTRTSGGALPDRKMTFFFTDRSIYRPGQTVYVKGIVINRPSEVNKSTIAPGYSTKVFLLDVNQQKIDSLAITTNEYGSWSGKFTLPANLLNGYFTISDPNSYSTTSFSVEEYKRPRFYTEINQPAGTYRVNDTIRVTGHAKAYAGNNIDGAIVKYRVVRSTVMPLWRYGYQRMIWPPYPQQQIEIAHGETTTDANGNFTVAFKAIPDNKMAKKDQPVFHYEITADVTDNAGETRSGSASVAVAYQALKLELDIAARQHKDSLKTVTLSSSNLAGSHEKSTVTLTIHKLQHPNRLFRERYWQQPDTFILSKEEYYKLFPYDMYADENDPAKWSKGEKVLDITDTTSPDSKFSLRNGKFSPGWYAVEVIAKDKYGEEVKAIQYIQLYDKNLLGPSVAAEVETDQATLEPGEKAKYRVSVNIDSAFVIQEIARKEVKEERRVVIVNNTSQPFEIPVTENDRGGMGVFIALVKHNRFYTGSQVFNIPYTNKELKISYGTYRDKTLPGSQEKWTVTVSGYKGEKATAEMLTAMYDASLDQFKPHGWSKPSIWSQFTKLGAWSGMYNFSPVNSQEKWIEYPVVSYWKQYDELLLENIAAGGRRDYRRGDVMAFADGAIKQKDGAVRIRRNVSMAPNAPLADELESVAGVAVFRDGNISLQEKASDTVSPPSPEQSPVQIRKNFNETAFFFPDLKTDEAGNITFSFTMPEAVTQWKWMSIAHTKELAFGYEEKKIVTQKELMVQPNAPRFLREGDRMDFSAKIVNITDKELTGQVELQLIDPATGTAVDGWFQNMFPNQYFTVGAGQSVPVNFTIEIPFKYNHPVTYKVIARSGTISDGEEATLPIVSNRMLVTESMPLPLRGQASKSFKLDKLLQSENSETLSHQALTVEFTSNPAWYAVQALPYLMDYPYECSEQVFNRYYANALASMIANASPRIKEIFERWKASPTGGGLEGAAALLSNLQKNEELKSVLLQETPWVLQAKSETEQKKNIALLFDMVRMGRELQSSLNKLRDLQTPNGGFAWFKGGPDDRFITQYILTGIGHLKKLKALPGNDHKIPAIINTAIPYLDQRIKESYDQLLRANKNQEPAVGGIGYYEIQYLYMRSFFPEKDIPAAIKKAYTYYHKQAQLHWLKQSRYMQGMIALALYRTGTGAIAKNIMTSLKQNALFSEEMGMYWAQTSGYFWYQAPIESQALLIEAFTEVSADTKSVNDMKTWLLKQKQTQHWRTTKATAEACYALLLQGSDWLTSTPEVTIRLGNYTVNSTGQQQEAGTGYFKETIEGKLVRPEMGNVQVFIKSDNGQAAGRPAWGAVYWQYFEDLDKITSSATPLKLTKKLFVEKNTDRGPVLQPLNEGDMLKVGDKVKVRIELRSDRAMEYVHMKDMRAACLEPVNVISQYKWQGGLGFYETTKDASTNFFFNSLPKGTFVFEYALFVTHTGTFSNGITSIQCMYAPEFSSHSEGVKLRVE